MLILVSDVNYLINGNNQFLKREFIVCLSHSKSSNVINICMEFHCLIMKSC